MPCTAAQRLSVITATTTLGNRALQLHRGIKSHAITQHFATMVTAVSRNAKPKHYQHATVVGAVSTRPMTFTVMDAVKRRQRQRLRMVRHRACFFYSIWYIAPGMLWWRRWIRAAKGEYAHLYEICWSVHWVELSFCFDNFVDRDAVHLLQKVTHSRDRVLRIYTLNANWVVRTAMVIVPYISQIWMSLRWLRPFAARNIHTVVAAIASIRIRMFTIRLAVARRSVRWIRFVSELHPSVAGE